MHIIYTLASGSLLLLAFLTFTNPRNVNKKANHWLGVFLFSFACLLLDRVLPDTAIYKKYPHLLGLTELTRFAMAPSLYMGVVYFTYPDRKFHRKDLLHFIPCLLFLFYIIPFFLHTAEEKRAILAGHFPLPNALTALIGRCMFYAIKIQIILYWVAAYIRLRRHQQNVQLFASNIGNIGLGWMRYFLLSLVSLIFLWFNELFFHIQPLIALTPWLFLVAVYCISYFSLRQPEIFDFPEPEVVEIRQIIQEQVQDKKAVLPRIAADQMQPLKDRLYQLMHLEKMYLEAELGLPDLAKRMKLSSHELSYLLNEGLGKNFFQFINEYRVEEAKRLLLSDQHRHLNMLGIAYEAGFSSKTTFNTTFKKVVGQSPSQFVQAHTTQHLKEALE
ncbi:AraC family transcriptional regulator [Hymenobacter tibetensis]|uniref:AraC family transcriptional regulator n=1 Tax=Hymenobacter tibetensis TaxID=497967 RepID=A0ABY4CU71_9BACT|nr:AraC family transcriptional regulator [Hymenobacter tibetensis]UOG73592.1 AraC family transcriptional regulator [Hymenobacter tibetensis]